MPFGFNFFSLKGGQESKAVALAEKQASAVSDNVEKCLSSQNENTDKILKTLGGEFQRRHEQHGAIMQLMDKQNSQVQKGYAASLQVMKDNAETMQEDHAVALQALKDNAETMQEDHAASLKALESNSERHVQFQREQLQSMTTIIGLFVNQENGKCKDFVFGEGTQDRPRGRPSNAMGGADADGVGFSPCRLCGEAANIMFMPCHHIMCCSACASVFKMCPECKGEIKTKCELKPTQ